MHRILASRRERQLMLLGDAPRGAPSLWPPESAEAGDVADLQFSSKEFYTRGPGSAKVGANFLSEKWISAEGPSGDSSQAERRGRGRRSVPSASGLQDVPNGLRGNGIQERGKDNGKAKLVLQPQEDSESDARADREDDSLWESAGRDRKNPSTKRVPEKDGTETNLDEKLLEVGRQEQSSEVESGRQQTLVEQGEDVEDQAERALAQLKRDSEGEILRESPLSVFEPSGPGSPSLYGSPGLSPLPSSTSDFFQTHPLPRPDFERIRAALDAADALFKTPSPALAAADAPHQTPGTPEPAELAPPRWSDPPVVSLPPRVRRLIAAANQLMHTPRGSGSLDGDSARRERRFSARSGDSLEDYPSLLEEEDYGPVHKTGEAITGPPQSLRSLRLTSPDEKGQELIAHLHDEPFSERVNHNHLLPDQGPSPVSPLPADSPISSALFGLNPVIHSDAEDSPLRLPDPQTGPFSSARDVQSHTDELRVAFFHTLETVDPGVFALGASFDSVTGVVFNPDMILCGEENSPRYASPVGTQHVLEAPQTKRLVIPDIQSKSLEIPYVPRMVKLSLKRAAAGAPKPFKPLKPPHAPGKPVRLSSESPLRRSGKNYWDFKHVGGGALRSIATGKVPGTDQPGEGQQNPSPPSSGTGGSPDSAAFPPASPPEDDWFDLDLFQEQRALPRIRTRRRTGGPDQAITRSFGNLYEVRNAVRAGPSATISRGIGRYGSPRTALQRRITTRSLSDWSDFLEARERALRLAHGALKRPPAGAPATNPESTQAARALSAAPRDAVNATQSLSSAQAGAETEVEDGSAGGGHVAIYQKGHMSSPVQAGAHGRAAAFGKGEGVFQGLRAAAATNGIAESPVDETGGKAGRRKGSAWACCFGGRLATTSLELTSSAGSTADGSSSAI